MSPGKFVDKNPDTDLRRRRQRKLVRKLRLDPFLPELRRQFALEGSALAFRELAVGRTNEAERVFAKIAAEIEPEGLRKSVESVKAALPRLNLATAGFDHVPPAVLNDHAETLRRLGRTDEARRLLERALADDPAFAPAKKTLSKLAVD